MASKTISDVTAKAREMGRKDGGQAAAEALEDGSYQRGAEHCEAWDAWLINAVGHAKAEELFGVMMEDEPEWPLACRAYCEGAQEAWDMAGEAE
jgi:hypothetical protein